jgi:predicted membrane-bound mannosyltransferase
LKSYENKPKDEMIAPDGLVSEGHDTDSGDSDAITTIDHVSVHDEKPAETVAGGDDISTIDETSVDNEESVEAIEVGDDEVDISSEEEEEEEYQRRHFWPPTREQVWTGIAFGAVLLLGAILRFWGLGDKPLHHDESLHAYFSMVLLHDNVDNWLYCAKTAAASCYHYDPLTHGPFQFHAIAFVYQISAWLGAPDHGINTTTVRIAAATLGTVIVGLPFLLRFHIGKVGAWLACFLLAVSPSLVYYSRFAREDIYMACFTLMLVVATARYLRSRNAWWLLLAALSLTLSYATKEATFLTIGVYGTFFGAVIVWELGLGKSFQTQVGQPSAWKRYIPKTAAPWVVLVYFILMGIIAKLVLGEVNGLSVFVTKNATNTAIADAYVAHLKTVTESILPWLGIALAAIVFVLLLREQKGLVSQERRGIARHVDPKKQRFIDTIVTMPWTHWFFALVCSWFVFMVLFTVLFTNVPAGLGDGIWQGLYYWVQQQQVARGGQPWYYYFILIPLYEQIGLVFGVVGVVRCLLRPTRLRLFLVFWFVGNVFIYTWAGEKMPWLTIHMTMPMMILAGIALEPAVTTVLNAIKARWGGSSSAIVAPKESVAFATTASEDYMVDASSSVATTVATSPAEDETVAAPFERDTAAISASEDKEAIAAEDDTIDSAVPASEKIDPSPLEDEIASPRYEPAFPVLSVRPRRRYALAGSIATIVFACILLIPTLQNMFQLSFVHEADAPHEMMIYVQTTTDVNTVMNKIDALDQKLYGGTHQLPIGISNDATWPFAWYMRDYTNVCFNYPDGCSTTMKSSISVVIASGDEMSSLQYQYSQTYLFHQYHLRTQWDQGYMPPPCQRSATNTCQPPQQYVGVGPWLWLTYGDNPPPGARFNLGKAASNIWQWVWYRKAFGSTDGTYDMGLFIKDDISVKTGIKP